MLFVRIALVFGCIFLTNCLVLAKQEQKVFFKLSSYTYSEPTTIESFVNKFNQSLTKGDHAFTENLIELGMQKSNFSISVFKRWDYFLKFSNDTARLYFNTENDIDFVNEESYQLSLKLHHIEAKGVKLAYQWQVLNNLQAILAVSYLDASDFDDGELYGNALWQGQDDYQVNAPASLFANENKLLNHPTTSAQGKGATIDLAISWTISDALSIDFKVTDLWGKISWKDALYHQINRWQVYRLDENGQLDTRPILQGSILNYQQKLPQKWLGRLKYHFNEKLTFYVQTRYSSYFNHQLFGVEINQRNNSYFSIAWHRQAESLELGYHAQYGYLRLMSDYLSQEKRHALSINTGFSLPF